MAYKRTPDKHTEIVVPVTPFLDMAFQLLFFFIATFNPASAREGQMVLSLPSAKTEAAAKNVSQMNEKAESHKEDVDIPAEFTITVRGYRDEANRGQISALTVTTTAGDEEIRGQGADLDAQRFDRDRQLRERLTSAAPPPPAEGKEAKIPTVRLSADSGILWGNVMQIMDVCYDAKFQVSFSKPPDFAAAP